ncbi:ABC transporter ATP-binding protein [Amycolatopsis coloradensis]|uniref:ABC transporter ATP-binding protein n=1 Tax=Amycolatopsis coloradensis TaxID=76021 RepID=A0ACD5BJX4_9PSEU
MNEVLYSVRNLTKSYQKRVANDGLSFDIVRSEIFGVLGDNGAGKSTLVRQMAGLTTPDSGSIELFGRDIRRNLPQLRETVSFMPQSSEAMNRLTVKEAIYYISRLRGAGRAAARAETGSQIDAWNLSGSAAKEAVKLSGGQRRLLQLAIATTGRLPVLLLDEPTNDLDPINREHVWDRLSAINRELGTTIFFITHDAQEAEKIIDRVAIMRDGRFLAIGTPAELKRAQERHVKVEYRTRSAGGEPVWKRYTTTVDDLHGIVDSLADEDVTDLLVRTETIEDLYKDYVRNSAVREPVVDSLPDAAAQLEMDVETHARHGDRDPRLDHLRAQRHLE